MNGGTTTAPVKRFLYLFQVEQDLPPALEQAAGADGDIVFLSWRARSTDPRSIYYPSSSWTQGRNRLLKEVLGREYLYVIFADDDITLELTSLGAAAAGPRANPWRVFEEFLRSHEPAVGCCAYDWHLTGGWFDPTQDCQTLRFFDAILNAFHRETLDVLLPYYDLLDEKSECYSQNLLCSLASDLYPGHVMQTNRIRVTNTQQRRDYDEFVLCKPEHLYLESLRDVEWAQRFARQSAGETARHPTLGPPLAKIASYALAEAELERHYDLGHPVWTRRRELTTLARQDEFFSEDADSPRARRWRAARKRSAPVPAPPIATARVGLLGYASLREWAHAVLQKPAVRSNPLFLIARDLYRSGGRPRAIAGAIRNVRSRVPARAIWQSWYRNTGLVHQIPESRQQEVLELLAFALNQVPEPNVVFVDVGAAGGDVLHRLRRTSLHKRMFSLGIDPIDLRGHRLYSGFVVAAITDGPERHADFFCDASSDCSSLKRMEQTIQVPTFNLSTIIRQYGLGDETLHFVKIDAQGSDLDVFRSLSELSDHCLFLRMETVCPESSVPVPMLDEGQTTFVEDRAVPEAAGFRLFNIARFGSTPEADVTFVNVRLFRELLPNLAK